MQNKFNKKKQVLFNWSFARTITRQFFLLVFAFVFFLQQVQAFSFLSNSVSQGKSSSVSYKVNKAFYTHFSLVHQQEPALTSVEMEVAEDDDKQDADVEFCESLVNKNGSKELAYDCILRSRYLQLISSEHQQTEVDYFILYHSWKKHLA
jgi:hypothetical protein